MNRTQLNLSPPGIGARHPCRFRVRTSGAPAIPRGLDPVALKRTKVRAPGFRLAIQFALLLSLVSPGLGAASKKESSNNPAPTTFAPLPAGPDGNRNYYSNGLANSMSAKTEHRDQAWEFLQFLGSERAAEIQAKTGTVIPAYEGHAAAYAKAMPEFDLQVFVDHLKYAQPFPASTDTAAWRDDATKQFADAWTGKSSVDEVSRSVAEKMNTALSKEKK